MKFHKKNYSFLNITFVTMLLLSTPAQALDVRIQGFADLVASKSNTDYNLGAINNLGKRLTLDSESQLGLNLSSDLGNDLFFSGQITTSEEEDGLYNLGMQWFFITYRPTERLAFRVGRQINPIYLYSEQIDVGYIYPWVRLPTEVYGIDPLQAFVGASAIYTVIKNDLQWRAQLFAGGGSFTLDSPTGPFSGTLDNDKGVDLSVSSDNFKVRLGYSAVSPQLTSSVQVPIAPGPITGTFVVPVNVGNLQIFSGGASTEYLHFMGMAEVIRIHGDGSLIRDSTGAYGTLGYHVTSKLTPYATYSWQGNLSGVAYTFPDANVSTTPKTDQHSWMLGLNFRTSPSVVVKGEYMRTQQHFVDLTKDFGSNTFTTSVDFVF